MMVNFDVANPHLRILFPLLFRESGREGGRRRDTPTSCLLHAPLPGAGSEPTTQARALNWEWNPQLLGPWANTPTTEPQRPGH